MRTLPTPKLKRHRPAPHPNAPPRPDARKVDMTATPHDEPSTSHRNPHRWRLAAAMAVVTLASASASYAQSSARRFPSIDLGGLTPSQQTQFLSLVDEELCPCEGEVRSLGECLEAPDGTCSLARESVAHIDRELRRNASNAEISHSLAQHLRALQTPHAFNLDGAPWKGAQSPRVTIVIFSDFECPYCRLFARVADQLLEAFPNDLRVYTMHFPLSIHRNAASAAIAATAAGRQGKFWEFHDIVLDAQGTLHQSPNPTILYDAWAEELGLDLERFRRDQNDPAIRAAVEAQRAQAQRAGATGTPAVYVNGIQTRDLNEDDMRSQIQRLLQAQTP